MINIHALDATIEELGNEFETTIAEKDDKIITSKMEMAEKNCRIERIIEELRDLEDDDMDYLVETKETLKKNDMTI